MNELSQYLGQYHSKVATNTQKALDAGFVTASYCLWNLGISLPERYQ